MPLGVAANDRSTEKKKCFHLLNNENRRSNIKAIFETEFDMLIVKSVETQHKNNGKKKHVNIYSVDKSIERDASLQASIKIVGNESPKLGAGSSLRLGG